MELRHTISLKSIFISFFLIVIAFSEHSEATELSFKKHYSQGKIHIYLASNKQHMEQDLANTGRYICNKQKLCVLWFFDDVSNVDVAIDKLKSSVLSDSVPGLIGIYSKNKTVNKLICYQKSGSC